jgi:hypothetical protein
MQPVERRGQLRQLRKIRIQLDDFVERCRRFPKAPAVERRARRIDTAIDATPLRARLELRVAFG